MHIFIDEAGAFLPPTSKPHAHSLVLAIIVPSGHHDQLCYDFLRLRDTWPHNAIEVKGSALTETQTAQVAQVLADHEVIVEFQALDMALHPDTVVSEFKERQADAITANVTPMHQPTIVRQLEELAAAFRTMPNQLFVQAVLTMHLVIDTVQHGTLYHVQRTPAELGRFCWMIDRKDHDLTAMERAWTMLILPAGEAQSTRSPFPRIIGADYSNFAKYEITEASADPEMVRHLAWMRETHKIDKPPANFRCLDWKRLLTEERSFADSKDHLGLQLADIAATTLRRALNRQLQQDGWELFGRLLVRKRVAPFVQIGSAASARQTLDSDATAVWHALTRHAKNMIVDE
jgi:hypothetical protein